MDLSGGKRALSEGKGAMSEGKMVLFGGKMTLPSIKRALSSGKKGLGAKKMVDLLADFLYKIRTKHLRTTLLLLQKEKIYGIESERP